MLEKRSLLLLCSVLGCAIGSVEVYADDATPSTTNDINLKLSIPQFKSGFEYNASFLALKPSASNLDYAINNKELPAQSPTWQEQELSFNYTPAFEIGARYIWGSRGQDVSLDWTHLNSSTSSSVAADGVSYFVGPNYEIGPDAVSIRTAIGNANFKYDVINLDAGQFLDFGKHVEMRFFGGLSTAFLREDVQATFSGIAPSTDAYPGAFTTATDTYSNFSGIGPRLGIHTDYNFDNGFGFLGEAAFSALIGTARARFDATSSSNYLQNTFHQSYNYQSISDQNNTQVVPGIDGKLGMKYKRTFNKGSILTAQLGYEAAVYVDAINEYQPASLAKAMQSGGIFVDTMSHTQSNYSVQGPFFQLKWQFA